jgi:hypothetical protein
MFSWLRHLFGLIVSALGSRKDLVLENLALREQLLALHAKRPRLRLPPRHKLFWVALRKIWSRWQKPLVLVTPRTIIAWHQALPAVLEMALPNSANWRTPADSLGDSRTDPSHGC